MNKNIIIEHWDVISAFENNDDSDNGQISGVTEIQDI